MTAPDPAWVEAGARASALWHRGETVTDSDDYALAIEVVRAVEPLMHRLGPHRRPKRRRPMPLQGVHPPSRRQGGPRGRGTHQPPPQGGSPHFRPVERRYGDPNPHKDHQRYSMTAWTTMRT